jgi:hypothetical protein
MRAKYFFLLKFSPEIINRMKFTFSLISMLAFSIVMSSCSQSSKNERPKNGDLNNSFEGSSSIPEKSFQAKKNKLLSEGWKEKTFSNGILPDCYNFKPRYSKIDNSLQVTVGNGTDVAIKLISTVDKECVRFVYIQSGTAYKIKNIPEGNYFLKIAYGKDWLSKISDHKCVGKFIRNPLYEKGKDIMDFNIRHYEGGYEIPSYKLQLDVISTDISNSFESSSISEIEFNR